MSIVIFMFPISLTLIKTVNIFDIKKISAVELVKSCNLKSRSIQVIEFGEMIQLQS